MTEIFGTVACEVANTIFAPWRMMPSRSTLLPTMNPATSARYTRGMLKALQSQMKRAALSEESTISTPPLTWLVGHDADGTAVDARKPDNDLLREQALDLEPRTR